MLNECMRGWRMDGRLAGWINSHLVISKHYNLQFLVSCYPKKLVGTL